MTNEEDIKDKKEEVNQSDEAIEENVSQSTEAADENNNQSDEDAEEAEIKKENTNVIHERTKVPPKEDLKTEDHLEMHNMTGRERRKYKRERYKETTADMSRLQKINYFIYCYKWRFIFSVLAVVCVAALVVTLYKNSRPVALSYAIVNSTVDPDDLDMSVISKDYMEFYGFGNDYQIQSTFDLDFDLETYEDDYSENAYTMEYTTFPTLCYNDYYDVIITDETGLNYLSYNSLVHPLDESMTADLYNIITSEYSDLITASVNYAGEDDYFAINISDTEFAKSIGLGYDDVYICFPGTSEDNYYNVKRLCNFIFDLDLNI